jgi:hypothetical protein
MVVLRVMAVEAIFVECFVERTRSTRRSTACVPETGGVCRRRQIRRPAAYLGLPGQVPREVLEVKSTAHRGAVLRMRSSMLWCNANQHWSRRVMEERAGQLAAHLGRQAGRTAVRNRARARARAARRGPEVNGSFVQGDMCYMGLLDRILDRRGDADRRAAGAGAGVPQPAIEVVLLDRSHDLEVVRESHYQDALWEVADLSCTGLVPWRGDGGEPVEQRAGLGGDLWGCGDGVSADVDAYGP